MRERQSGFGAFFAVVVLVIVIAAVIVGWYAYRQGYISGNSQIISLLSNGKNLQGGGAVLSGVVTEGPTQPVCRTGAACTAPVANHTLDVEDARGNIVASTKTDGNGYYVVHIKPGDYVLVLVPKRGLGADPRVKVGGGSNTFDVAVDTGIR